MDNKKRTVHNSGPLGMLVRNGQVKKVEENIANNQEDSVIPASITSNFFKTQSGIEFNENDLMYVDPSECTPWKYANRSDDELEGLDELIESIKLQKQLQPALVTPSKNPDGKIKYEVIFGRRRYLACLKLGIPLLVIVKEFKNIQEAVAVQNAENKYRDNVSTFSNAKLYKKLLDDGVFNTEKALATKLSISLSSLNDIMVFNRLPNDIVTRLPNIHKLSISIALKINSLIKQDKQYKNRILEICPMIGKTINSQHALERAVTHVNESKSDKQTRTPAKVVKSECGKKLFSYKVDFRGNTAITINKDLRGLLSEEELCSRVKVLLEDALEKSGAPD